VIDFNGDVHSQSETAFATIKEDKEGEKKM